MKWKKQCLKPPTKICKHKKNGEVDHFIAKKNKLNFDPDIDPGA